MSTDDNTQIEKKNENEESDNKQNLEKKEEGIEEIKIKEIPNEQKNQKQTDNLDYQLLREDYPEYDLSFKIIVIGDSGKL